MNGRKLEVKDMDMERLQESAKLMLAMRQLKREASGLNALMAKHEEAQKAGLELNERDRARLLALLLEDILEGTGSA
jgi:hypothetical protein